MGLTLWGARQVACHQPDGAPEVILENRPGSLYVSGVCGVEHQVRHPPSLPSGVGLWHCPGLGPVEVSIMFRTSVFRFSRARVQAHLPSPVEVFHGANKAVMSWLSSEELLLPSLADLQRAAEE